MIARCYFETFRLYRELYTNYSAIYLIYIFRYDLSIQIACRCVDGWSNSVGNTKLPRLSYPVQLHSTIIYALLYPLAINKFFFLELLQFLTQKPFDIFTIFSKLNKQCTMLSISLSLTWLLILLFHAPIWLPKIT